MAALDLMQSDEIKEGLGTEILGREIISYAQTSSTNDIAFDLAAKGMQEGTLVVAEYQTAGRGRRERKWLSHTGTSILASVILRPPIMAHEAHSVTLISAAAVAQAIRSMTQLPALIKWPNDVTIGDKKVSGLLTEMRTEGKRVSFLVVGMGVTVNMARNHFPAELRDSATSLSAELGHTVPRIALLQEILRQLECRSMKLKEHETDALTAEWKGLSATIGRRVRISLPRRIVRGHAVDMDENGILLIRADTGEILRVTADDVVKLRID
jgi:BirA family biotin operon repressor/biotin-[acetyl-CoA-carboxylase] ligase